MDKGRRGVIDLARRAADKGRSPVPIAPPAPGPAPVMPGGPPDGVVVDLSALWLVSVGAALHRPDGSGHLSHGAIIVQAGSESESRAKAIAHYRQRCPMADGWQLDLDAMPLVKALGSVLP